MCDLGKAVTRAVTPAGTGGREAAAIQELAAAQASANAALLAQQQAQDQATAAADSASERSRIAAESRQRKLLAAGSFGATLPSDFGSAPTGFRQLFGG